MAREHLGREGRLEPGLRVVEDLRLDSLELLTLSMELESRFDVTLDGIDPASTSSASPTSSRLYGESSTAETPRPHQPSSGRMLSMNRFRSAPEPRRVAGVTR